MVNEGLPLLTDGLALSPLALRGGAEVQSPSFSDSAAAACAGVALSRSRSTL